MDCIKYRDIYLINARFKIYAKIVTGITLLSWNYTFFFFRNKKNISFYSRKVHATHQNNHSKDNFDKQFIVIVYQRCPLFPFTCSISRFR